MCGPRHVPGAEPSHSGGPRGGFVRGLGVDPDVVQDLPDLRALGDTCNQAHLPQPWHYACH